MDERPLTIEALARFHREVALPDIERIVDARLIPIHLRFEDVFAHFDAIYKRFDRVDSEIAALTARIMRLEK